MFVRVGYRCAVSVVWIHKATIRRVDRVGRCVLPRQSALRVCAKRDAARVNRVVVGVVSIRKATKIIVAAVGWCVMQESIVC